MRSCAWWSAEAQQASFRAVLDAHARPGRIAALGDADAPALLHFLSTVLDESVDLADPHGLIDADTRRLLMAPAADAAQARFVVLAGAQAPREDWTPALGTLEAPEGGATLVLQVQALSEAPAAAGQGLALRLQGPGVAGERRLHVQGLHPGWLRRRAAWVDAFPLGVDLVLAAPRALAALPRRTRIDWQEA